MQKKTARAIIAALEADKTITPSEVKRLAYVIEALEYDTETQERLWTAKELAKYMRVTVQFVYQLLNKGELERIRLHKRKGTRIPDTSVRKFMARAKTYLLRPQDETPEPQQEKDDKPVTEE